MGFQERPFWGGSIYPEARRTRWSQFCQELGTEGSRHKEQLFASTERKNWVFLIVQKIQPEQMEEVGGGTAIRHRQGGLAPLCTQPMYDSEDKTCKHSLSIYYMPGTVQALSINSLLILILPATPTHHTISMFVSQSYCVVSTSLQVCFPARSPCPLCKHL